MSEESIPSTKLFDTNQKLQNYHTIHNASSDTLVNLAQVESPRFNTKNDKLQEIDFVTTPVWNDYKSEMYYLFTTGLPVIVAMFLSYAMPLANIFSIGHLGTKQLGAAALSNMFAAITGWSLSIGMATALDTLCSQAFTGSNNPHAVGLHLQRGILVSLTMFIPISFVWLNSEKLMLLIGQDPELSKLCGVYMKHLLFGAPAFMAFECLKRYFQAQKIMRAQTDITIAVLPINLILVYFLVMNDSTSLGFKGAPIASSITYWLCLTFGILYSKYINGSQCWGGFTKQALTGWGPYIKLGVPGILQLCSEWWAFEIMSLAASYLGTNELAAQSIVLSITNTVWSVPVGMSIAASNRIGNLLGASMPIKSKHTSRCALVLALIMPFFNSTFLLLFSKKLSELFTDDQKVIEIVQIIIPVAALYQIFDSVFTVSNGILRGQGKQAIGAIVNVIAFYIIAIPLGLYVTFQWNFGVLGLWFGTCLALLITSSTLGYVILTCDWELEVNNCKNRLKESKTSF
ncbi:MATE efflux family protein [Neoconidiobolus thromboides FSU 785]|nr:MATE efflux family protein [Neoconidiobolus thromboides FSU 785]